MVDIEEYIDSNGKNHFGKWFATLSVPAAAKIVTALARIEQGNFSNVKGVKAGVFEYRIAFGPGYRVYFGKDGSRLVVLLTGGSKKRQSKDIEFAHALWGDYKKRKRQEL